MPSEDAAAPSTAPVSQAEATTPDGTVLVKPVASYLCSATGKFRNPGDPAYPVERGRAAELFASRLVDYADAADEIRAEEVQAKAHIEAARASRKRQGAPT